jgi:DnaJ-class molecular chaperone
MARDTGDGEDPAEDGEDRADASHEPRECMPCRGTGQVISNLGGTPSSVSCPWCGGGGVRLPEVDAQERWKQEDGGDSAVEAPAPPAAE